MNLFEEVQKITKDRQISIPLYIEEDIRKAAYDGYTSVVYGSILAPRLTDKQLNYIRELGFVIREYDEKTDYEVHKMVKISW